MIVDTPGFDDKCDEKDEQSMNSVIGYLENSGGVNAFVIVLQKGRLVAFNHFQKKNEICFYAGWTNH